MASDMDAIAPARREWKDQLLNLTLPLTLLLAFPAAFAQTGAGTASVTGTVLDAKTGKAVSAAWVVVNRAGAPPVAKKTKSGGDGSFQIQGLAAGTYSICVQAAGDQYLDPCQWSGSPAIVMLNAGQTASGMTVKLTAASSLYIHVNDPQSILGRLTNDGRHPEFTVGVWGPRGLYYPAQVSGGLAVAVGGSSSVAGYSYHLAVPLDTALNFYIASHDLQLGDANGTALSGNASQQTFQHATGDANPKSFAFTVLGLMR